MQFKQFKQDVKANIARTLLHFENIKLSQIETKKLLATQSLKRSVNEDDAIIVKNLLKSFDYIESLDLSQVSIDMTLYKKLNSLLAFEQALYAGELRSDRNDVAYIPCIEDAIEPADIKQVEHHLNKLSNLTEENFKEVVADSFMQLSRLQPFYDGNKRSVLFLCNIALAKKELGSFSIPNELYPEFEKKLTLFYRDGNEAPLKNLITGKFVDKKLTQQYKLAPPKITAIEAKNYHTDKIDYIVFDERDPNTAFIIGKDSFNPKTFEDILNNRTNNRDNTNYIVANSNDELNFTSNVEILDGNCELPNDLIYVKNDYEGYEGLLPNKESLILFGVKYDFTRNKDTKNITITGTGKDTDIVKINVKNTKLEKFTADNSVVLFDTDSVKVNKFTINNSMVLTDKDTVIRTNEFISNNVKVAHIGNDETNGKLEISANIIEIDGIKGKDVDIDFIQWGTAAKKTEINKATTDGKIKFNIHNNAEINNSKGDNGTEIELEGYENNANLNKVENITKLTSASDKNSINMENCQVGSQQVIDEFKGEIHYDKNTKISLANKSTEKTVTQAIVKSPELGQG